MGEISSPFSRRVIIVSGKGGVGKSTVAAAMGVIAARLGRKTLIIELAGQTTMTRLLGGPPGGYEVVERRPNLFTQSVTPAQAMQEYLVRELHSRFLYQITFKNRFVAPFVNAVPGLDDLVSIGKVMDVERTRNRDGAPTWDTIVVDAPSTGQGINLLRVPRAMMDMTGAGPFFRNTKLIHDLLLDPTRTIVHLVTLPEEMPVNETIETFRRLEEEVGVTQGAVIVNHVREQRFSLEELQGLEAISLQLASRDRAMGGVLRGVVGSVLQLERRARLERSYLARLESEIPRPMITLPALATRDLGPDEVDLIADRLESRFGRLEDAGS